MRTVIECVIESLAADLPEWRDVQHRIGGYVRHNRILWTREPDKPTRFAVERMGYMHGTITYGDPIDRIAWFLDMDPRGLAERNNLRYPMRPRQVEEDAA